MSDRLARFCVDAFLTFNSCAWPWILGGVALWRGDLDRLWHWVTVGVLLGGGIFLIAAAVCLHFKPTVSAASPESGFWRHIPSARKFAGAAMIMFLLGGAGMLAMYLWPQPPIYRFPRS